MESTSSRGGGGGGQHIRLPPGFRFHPTDEELVVHYLQKRAASAPIPAAIITEIDLYKFDPWELPGKACFGEQEWYFFSPRERKYPNGERPNRAATSGYWKATGTDKPILTANGTKRVGVKKALVFYGGKPPKGIKTNWIMHEYRLVYNNSSNKNKPPGITNKGSSRLDDWVLCRIFMKSNWSSQPVDNAHEPTSSIDVHNQSPIFNQEPEKPWNFFSAAPPSEKGSAIPFASSSSPSKSSYFSSQFLNEMPANDHQTLAYSGNQVEDSSTHDEGNNPTPINGTSFISLLNQQYSNPSGDFDGGGDLASILPTSQFPSSVNK